MVVRVMWRVARAPLPAHAHALASPPPPALHTSTCPQDFDLGKLTAFPRRDQHFFPSIDTVRRGGGG